MDLLLEPQLPPFRARAIAVRTHIVLRASCKHAGLPRSPDTYTVRDTEWQSLSILPFAVTFARGGQTAYSANVVAARDNIMCVRERRRPFVHVFVPF